MAERDGRDQLPEADPLSILTRLPEVVINDHDALRRPPQGDGPLDEGILVFLARTILAHLLGGGLSDIDIGATSVVLWRNLVRGGAYHASPPAGSAADAGDRRRAA